MDWLANQDAIKFFLEEVWDLISAQVPDAKMTVVGRSPPANLVDQARRRNLRWDFTGYVDDVRPYMQGAAVSVIPIRVGGGTRLKAYEAMAAGNPIVSTAIGIEGLPIVDGEHYLRADEAKPFAAAVVSLLRDVDTRMRIATQARALVESRFSYVVAARVFEDACTDAVSRFHSTRA
jgi:glycosyltransferase involved in cell wall biosynthesis